MTQWTLKGHYLKNCNCNAACSCDLNGFPSPQKNCEGMAGMKILEGSYGDVTLDGTSWVVMYHWPGALHEGNGTVQAFIDESTSEDQRNALLQILSGQEGNAWFEFLASTVTNMLEPKFVPIKFDFDKENRTAHVLIKNVLETKSSPLAIPNTKLKQSYNVNMPNGMEYRNFEVAQSTVLKGTGEIKFDLENTHSSLAEVEHTDKGIIS